MEARGHGHAPPFWASSSPTSSTNASTSTQSGIRPWIVVVVLCIVVLLFFPSVVSSPFKSGRLGFSVKSGWDMLNVCLVVFAIACGFLGRIGEGSGGQDAGSFKQQQPRSEWTGYGNSMGDANRMAAMRRMRSSSSYPDLRTETTAVWGQSNRAPDGWRPYDDGGQLYRAQSRPVQMYQMPGFGEEEQERECKTVSNDMGSGTIDYGQEWRGREAMVARRRMRSLEALPRWEQEEEQEQNEPPVVVAGRWRRRSLERFPSIEENMEKETHFLKMEAELGADDDRMVEERPPVMAARRRRKSLESFETMHEIEEEAAKVEEEEMAKRTESILPEIEEMEKDGNFEEENVAAEKTPVVVEVAPPLPPPPPPPPPLEAKLAEECGKHRRSGSGGGAKDLASAIALFYQKKKKKGSKSKRKEKHEQEQPSIVESNPNSNSNSVTESNNGNASGTAPSTAPPPPPPPPPASSIFHQLFSNKKGASKSRRIHSLSASTYSSTPAVNAVSAPPPPPAPRPPHQGSHRTRKNEVASTGYRRIEDTELYHEHRRTRERSNLSPYAHYPLPPRSPLPPPPPSPPPVCENVPEKIGSPAVSCPSPDVNDKADLFIRRFRDGLKLEKINSIKEKVKRKGRQEEDETYDDEIQT